MNSRMPNAQTPWHGLDAHEVVRALDSDVGRGLVSEEAATRLQEHGPNALPPAKRRGPLVRFVLQFHNVLIYVLLAAGSVTLLLEHWIDAAVIFGVVVINAVVGFIQEGKAERALESIRSMLAPSAVVVRDGQKQEIPVEQLVPGDIVVFASGDRVPADVRLMRASNLRIDEALLTGESVPAEKTVEPAPTEAPLAERTSMAYSGSMVAVGQGRGVVVRTGLGTEIGRISGMLAEITTLTTPLLRNMATFARILTGAIIVISAATFAFGVWFRGLPMDEMFLAVVGIAVAAIPEGLPAIMTITLAIGVQRMAGRNAIIRRLPAVETLGSVTVICTDKTGTLTRNEMTVRNAVTAEGSVSVGGEGYVPEGAIEGKAADAKVVLDLARGAALCNEAELRQSDGDWQVAGDPTEGALLAFAAKAGVSLDRVEQEFPRLDVIPFESEHRFMATLHHDHRGNHFLFLKGAPEQVLTRCNRERFRGDDRPLDPRFWHDEASAMAERGQRVLAVAFAAVPPEKQDLTFADVDGGLTMLGLVGLIDPPRSEAADAIRRVHEAGIDVKMITGDNGVTAAAIGRQLGLSEAGSMTGDEVAALDDEGMRRAVREHDVFARAAPEHKLKLVRALQADGHVVAMTGDGVNDSPALKRADVGVAMGRKGTEAAKQAAEMVLADDNFATIAAAVEEGRVVYENLKKGILFILPTNGGEALVVILAILIGYEMPLTPKQVLWVNMITAVTLALALAFEAPEPGIMKRPPRRPDEPLLSRFLVWRVTFVSILLLMAVTGLFLWELGNGAGEDAARTVAVNVLVMGEIFYLWNVRHLNKSVFSVEALFGSRAVLIAIGLVIVFQLLFTYAPPMQLLFDTAALGLGEWARILGVGLVFMLIVEGEKALVNRSRR